MFKYVIFNKVKIKYTVEQFRGGNDNTDNGAVKVNYFTNATQDVVSIESAVEANIDALIAKQPASINCQIITATQFYHIVHGSDQINIIRKRVEKKIRHHYSIGDEFAMLKIPATDTKRIAYDNYVANCIKDGKKIKAEMGYTLTE